MPPDTDNVALAVVQNDIKHIRQDVEDMRKELKYLSTQIVLIANDQLARITDLEKDATAYTERWKAHEREHAKEMGQQRVFAGVISAITSLIAAIVGIRTSP
jgi:TolA-binding protein